MRLLEFQAKELFREYGINLLDSKSSTNIEEGRKHAKELGYPFVIKIQVPVGGRVLRRNCMHTYQRICD